MEKSPKVDPAALLKYIKSLQATNGKLLHEKNEIEHELKQNLLDLQQKYNAVISKEVVVSKDGTTGSLTTAPVAQNQIVENLTNQNITLRQKLENHFEKDTIQDLIDKEDFNGVIQKYREIIKKKDEDISILRQNIDEPGLRQRVSHLRNLLQKTKAVNKSYIHEITSLQNQLDDAYRNLGGTTNEETVQAQAVSGDQDVNGSISPPHNLTTELQELKVEKQQLFNELQQTRHANKDIMAKLNATVQNNEELRSENECLSLENQKLKTLVAQGQSDFPVESQMKIFVEDFNSERKEKEELYKKQEEMQGENSRLKEQLDQLHIALQEQAIGRFDSKLKSAAEWQPMHDQHGYFPRQTSYSSNPVPTFQSQISQPPKFEASEYTRQTSGGGIIRGLHSGQVDPQRRIGFNQTGHPIQTPPRMPQNSSIRCTAMPYSGQHNPSSMFMSQMPRRSNQPDSTDDAPDEIPPELTKETHA